MAKATIVTEKQSAVVLPVLRPDELDARAFHFAEERRKRKERSRARFSGRAWSVGAPSPETMAANARRAVLGLCNRVLRYGQAETRLCVLTDEHNGGCKP